MSNITINSLQVHYEVTGTEQGKEIIFLHGWGSSLEVFRNMIRSLETNFKIYALDFPGFGKSDPPEEVWGVNEYACFLEELVQKLEIKNPVIVGHSFGGRVAIIYASRNKLNKLILVDAAGVKPQRSMKYYFKVYSFKLGKKLLPLLIGKKKARERIEQYRKKAGSSDYNNASGIMRDILVKVVNEDLKRFMPLIQVPTLLIWGENDTATTVREAKIMEKLIPDSGLVVLKDAGHFSFLDKPFDVNIIVDAFLKNDKIINQ